MYDIKENSTNEMVGENKSDDRIIVTLRKIVTTDRVSPYDTKLLESFCVLKVTVIR